MRTLPVFAVIFALAGCAPLPAPTQDAAPQSNAPRSVTISVASGQRQRIDYINSLNPDCTSAGFATVQVIAPPTHGTLTTQPGSEYSTFPKDNQRYPCNLQKSPAMDVYYTSAPGFIGADSATIQWTSPVVPTPKTVTFQIAVR